MLRSHSQGQSNSHEECGIKHLVQLNGCVQEGSLEQSISTNVSHVLVVETVFVVSGSCGSLHSVWHP